MKKPMNQIVFIVLLLFMVQCANKFYTAGQGFYEAGNYKDAIDQYDQWISEDSDNHKAYLARAKAYQKTGDIESAADDYSRAAALDEDETYFIKASELYFEIDQYERSSKMAEKAIELDKNNVKAHKQAIDAFVEETEYEKAYDYANQLIDIEETGDNYYWRGYIADKLDKFSQAEKDLRKAIEIAPDKIDAYISLADVLYKSEKFEASLTICNKGLEIDKKNKDLLETRSAVYREKLEYPQAINDLSRVLLFSPEDEKVFLKRGLYYQEFNQDLNAINDFSKVISLNSNLASAYYYRAKSHENVTNYKEAARDYQKYLTYIGDDEKLKERIKEVKDKVYELLREEKQPEIVLADSILHNGNTLKIRGDAKKLLLAGHIKDQSKIKYLKVNGKSVDLEKRKGEYHFDSQFDIQDLNQFIVRAEDVYQNTKETVYKIERTEVVPPEINLTTPYASYDGEIYLQTNSPKLYLEGKIEDESLIQSISIGAKTASFSDKVMNPEFSATLDVVNRSEFTVEVTDIYGNVSQKVFTLNREGAQIAADNPMGKTWVVFIENSDYQTFASLDGPVKDVSRIKAALANYQIHNFLHKKNLTKEELDRFFSIELRDLVKANKVNSLLIWYAGHGKFINETGYWVPIDARRDDEFSYFNINNLKASLQGYSDLITHTLVVTDACESGPSFYQAMRSIHKKRDCGNWKDTRAKSAQVLSSAGYELAVDQSQFTESFANTLVNNPNACLPIEDVVSKVTLAVTKAGRQQPQFGKIDGLEDEGGTFFFISKEK